ncbi:hypothetical protein ACFFX1_36350 [Dactylosporangium sucinum]|uniref:Uncharacterized protein n=1 Tax=Dactylosporangium sucinum TaxID=1424081 RepID=A0A917TTV0_9ACTN|nr:hypothetical protein [Dactylosporangium sucinum]GGM37662.1 hypothetical protein GCM10007977_043930 [Dactylosporangium sucinum]
MSTLSTRPKLRAVAAVLAVTVIGTLLGIGLVGSWSELSRQRGFVTAERAGVAYLRPLTALIGALTAAESAAVRGQPIDTGGLRTAVAGVAGADAAHGAALGATVRWSEVQQRIATLIDEPGTGQSAHRDFGDVVSLAIELTVQVGDASNLILDPELDAYYLMDVGLMRLPTVMFNAARVADLVALPLGADTASERAAAVAVARYEVAVAAAQISTGLKKSVLNTERSALGTDITGEQDAFQNAVDALTPPALVRQLSGPVTGAGLEDAAARVNHTAVTLVAAIWDQLDGLLADRQAGLVSQQRLVIAGAAGVLAGAVVLLWLLAPDRRSRATDEGTEGSDEVEAAPEQPQISMIDARDLLGAEELVHVGRGVQARRRERDGAE